MAGPASLTLQAWGSGFPLPSPRQHPHIVCLGHGADPCATSGASGSLPWDHVPKIWIRAAPISHGYVAKPARPLPLTAPCSQHDHALVDL